MPKASKPTKKSSGGGEASVKKTTKKVTAYNVFLASELKRVKEANPTMTHKEAFKQAASNWKVAPENPKANKDK
ncbi:hypothetical protein HK098_007435 [Nowakowskiella sp. JEL0407]|nr:hypothetical protein HK098_007435 [Nowakowskiella sp. JEL0407]